MRTSKPLITPPALRQGDRVGVFTPSWPAHLLFPEKYQHGLSALRGLGFHVVAGEATRARISQGYRTASPRDRADEFMQLVRDREINALIATMGGLNSSSMIPYLDFDEIRAHPKVICGYSDVTALHLAILAFSGVRTFYGPAVVNSFGEWPDVLEETRTSFLDAVSDPRTAPRALEPPKRWSNHFRDALTDAWRTQEREYQPNPGWRALRRGTASGHTIVANLETLLFAAGTPCFPDLSGKILIVEDWNGSLGFEERAFRQLEAIGAFDAIAGLVVGKPERADQHDAPFTFEDLVLEIVGPQRSFPIVTNFDCGHTHPMLTIAEMTRVTLIVEDGFTSSVIIDEPMVVPR
jgi:muramoyltetrapeptide carboxypeptidase